MSEDLEEHIEIPAEAVGLEGSSVYLQCAEVYTVEELLYGLLLRSGNDCAVALALHFGGDISTFCTQMNLTAQKAGALHSNFVNPHGLPAKNHVTTARDLCYIARYAMKNPTFRKIVATKYYEPRNWANKNKMLHNCEGGIGIKTGYTKEAGRCLVSAAKRGNMTVISTVLNYPSMYERSIQLIDDAFKTYDYVPLLTTETILSIQGVKGKVRDNYFYPISEGEKAQLEIRTAPSNSPQMEKIVGQFGIYLSKRLLFSGNLYKL
jgi:D-alanyl-D-alanine carboxypeptidase (penicillin-binding protein 5/6)